MLIFCLTNCSNDDNYTPLINLEERLLAGGDTTVFSSSSFAFSNPATNLSAEGLKTHNTGDAEFEKAFVSPGSLVNTGLGPRFNNNACIDCHPSDGCARFPETINAPSGLLYRLSLGNDLVKGPIAVPDFGTQAQNQSVVGFQPELAYTVHWKEYSETLSDGTKINLRKPVFGYQNPYTSIPQNVKISPRIAPPVFGLGLLEFIPESDILALEDIYDSDKNGISGKANYVLNPETGKTELGRFGWKANTPSLRIQTAAAYHADMGITNEIFATDTPTDGLLDDPEISSEVLAQVTFYCQTLAVPAPRNIENDQVRQGATLFNKIQCNLCHTPKQRTLNAPITALQNQTIWPYTDMLLHDMGKGLADNRGDFLANGQEWKTRPLWGIGLTYLVNDHTNFLHDGRARNITEAILWHGGEAKQSKEMFKSLSSKEREKLLIFINSL